MGGRLSFSTFRPNQPIFSSREGWSKGCTHLARTMHTHRAFSSGVTLQYADVRISSPSLAPSPTSLTLLFLAKMMNDCPSLSP